MLLTMEWIAEKWSFLYEPQSNLSATNCFLYPIIVKQETSLILNGFSFEVRTSMHLCFKLERFL